MQHMPEVPDGFACICVIGLKGLILYINDHLPETIVGVDVLLFCLICYLLDSYVALLY